jgi:hypothetical protein
MEPTTTPVHHPDLANLFALRRHLRPRAPMFVWQGEDGTEALLFGRTVVAAVRGGPLREAPTAAFPVGRDGHAPSVEEIVGDLLRRRDNAVVTADGTETRASVSQVGAVVTAIRGMEGHGYAAAGDADSVEAHFRAAPPPLSVLRAIVNDLRRLVPIDAHLCRDKLAALSLDLPHIGVDPARTAHR